MPFDMSTAKPVSSGGFDLSSAQPVSQQPQLPSHEARPGIAPKSGETRAAKELPEFGSQSAGFFAGEDKGQLAKWASIMPFTPDPQEQVAITKSLFPHVTVRQDESGNFILRNPSTGKDAVVRSGGLTPMTAIQGGVTTAAMLPAATAAAGTGGLLGVGAGALGAVLTQGAIEAGQAATGGSFDPSQIGMAGALGGVGEGVAKGLGAVSGAARGVIPEETKRALSHGKVLTSDVNPPETFMQKLGQKMTERVPIVGTGKIRAAQQVERQNAVSEAMNRFGVNGDTPLGHEIVQSADRFYRKSLSRASEIRNEAKSSLDELGDFVPNNAIKAIDEQIAKQQKFGAMGDQALIEELNSIKSEMKGNFSDLVEKRTLLYDMQKDVGSMKSPMKTGADQVLSQISGGLTKDLNEFSKNIPKAYSQWKASNKIFGDSISKAKDTQIKQLLTKGKVTPEVADVVIKSGKQSDLTRLWANLDEPGRESVKKEILKQAFNKASTADYINPNAFNSALNKMKPQVDTFFKGEDRQFISGVQKYLAMTRRAQDAATDIASKQEVTGLTLLGSGAAAGSGLIGAKVAIPAAAAFSIARMYETKPIRDMIIRLKNAKPGSRAEKAILMGIRAEISSQGSQQ